MQATALERGVRPLRSGRIFLIGLLLAVWVVPGRTLAAGPAGAKPNIIIIMADDLGYGDLGCYGNTYINTPTLDALAQSGIRFTDYHANGSVCSPTRAALMTGRYQQRAGFDAFPPEFPTLPYSPQEGFALSETTFAEALKAAGYATAIFGKWHLGWPAEFNPIHQGFDEFKGFLSGNVDYFSHVSQEGQNDWWNGDQPTPEEGYATDLLTRYSLEFIEANTNRPFCLYLPHACPHYPWQAPEDVDLYQRQAKEVPAPGAVPDPLGTSPDQAASMKAMVEEMDAGIGQIMTRLSELGLAENTFVFFCSDNGAWPPTGVGTNGPLGGIKGDLFEGGHRVPAIAYWPGTINPGVSSQTVMAMDLFPTMLSMAGQEVPAGLKLDGTDLMPLLLNGTELPARTLFWKFGTQRAVRKGPWKLVKGVQQNADKTKPSIKGDFLTLYNLDEDIAESNDLSASQSGILQELLQELAAWEEDINTPQPVSYIWTGGDTNANWTGSNNWTPAVVPGSTDIAIFDSASSNKLTIDLAGAENLAGIAVGAPSSNVILTNGGAALRLAGVDMSAAAKDLSIHHVAGGAYMGPTDGSGWSIDVAAGRMFTLASKPGASSQVQIDKSILTLSGAGTVNLATRNLELGRSAATSDSTTLNISFGTLQVAGDSVRALRLWTGTNTINQTGGNVAADTLNMALSTNLHANTYQLAGGTLQAGRVFSTKTTGGTETFAFNGGTLQAGGGSVNSNDFISSTLDAVRMDAGGGTIDTAGYNVTANHAMTGAGALAKTGSGTLVLGKANTYAGGTQVGAGTLVVSAAATLGSGDVAVDDGAVLTLNGAAIDGQADVVVGSAGLINLDFDGTNLVKSLSLDGGSTTVSAGVYGAGASNLTGTGFLQALPAPVPAAIVGWSVVSPSMMRMVVHTPDQPELYYPQTTTNLVTGPWTGVAHSDDGVHGFVVTNVGYSTAEGSNAVIYMQLNHAGAFFGIGER